MAASGIKDDDYVMFDRINANLKEAQSKDLYSFAISQKVIQPPKMLNLNSDLTPQLAERRRDIALIKGHYGQTPSGLTEEETKTITEHLNSLPPSEKVKKLGQIVVGLGGAATPLLSKMSKGDRVLANAGALVASGRTELATKVLTGMQFIQEQQLKLAPKFNDTVESDSRDLIPSTSNPAFYNDIITMAKGVYATKAVKDRDYSPTYNSDRWEESIKEVMGGEVLSINPKGRSFLADNYHIAPPVEGMDEEKFTKWVDSITDNEIVQLGGWAGWASGMSDQLKKASFEQAGFGRYVALIPSKLSSTGYTPVMDRSGKPFILDYQQVKDLRSGTKLPVIQDVNQDKFNFRIDDIYKAIVKKPLSQDTISKIVDEMSTKYGVPSNLVAAVIKQESDGNPKAVSGKGAIGLMQLLPGTAKDMGVTNIHDPKQNIEGGVKYLKAMLDKYKGDVPKALAAYNSGPGTVNRANGIPNIKETQQYVAKIMDSINRAN
jgi:hypothetical protein